ncbi:MAG TPA: PEP-CTERM sorting domain-containing protein [Longimicrobiales bacterium]
MRKRIGLALLGAGLLLPAAARAADIEFNHYCTLGAFKVCASVHVFASSDFRTITLRLWNLETNDSAADPNGQASTFTAIGLYHANSAFEFNGNATLESATFGGLSVASLWTKSANSIQAELGRQTKKGNQGGIVGCTDPGGTDHLQTCNSFPGGPFLELTFHTDEAFSLESLQFRLHAQQVGPDQQYSVKCDSGDGRCVPTNVVPEPITTVLLGSGLLGIAGAARRRRKGFDVASA